jgi:hypothetical protein
MLHRQEPYKKRVKAGDVFSLKLDDCFLFGQVTGTGAPFAGFPSPHRIVVFNHHSLDRSDWQAALSTDPLIAPHFINNLGFSRGFMPVMGSAAVVHLDPASVCYSRTVGPDPYLDEFGSPCEPRSLIGVYGLGNYLTLQDLIESALAGRA